MSKITSKKIALALNSLVRDDNQDATKTADNLFTFVKKNHLEHYLNQILYHVVSINTANQKKEQLTIVSRHALTDADTQAISLRVTAVDPHTLKTSKKLQTKIDFKLLGGFVAYYKGKKYDASVNGRLERLRLDLKSTKIKKIIAI